MIWGELDATAAILKERGALAPAMPFARVRLVCTGMRPFETAYPRVRLVGAGFAASRRPARPSMPAPVAPAPTVVPFKRVRIIGVGGDEPVKVHKLPKRLQSAATATTTAKALSAAVARVVAVNDCQARAWLQTAQAVVNDQRPARVVLQEMLEGRARKWADELLREDLASFGLPPLVPEFERAWFNGLL